MILRCRLISGSRENLDHRVKRLSFINRHKLGFVALCMAGYLLVVLVAVNFHSHLDGKEKSKCAVCEVKYHSTCNTITSFTVPEPSVRFLSSWSTTVHKIAATLETPSYQNRAPPFVTHSCNIFSAPVYYYQS